MTLGALQGGAFFDQVLGHNTVKFDWAKFTWIGSPERLEAQLYMRADSPYKTLEDIRRAAEPPRCGGAGTGATGYFVPKILEETLGLKFKTVTGYQSGGEIDIAVERGELHCRAFDIGSFVGREPTRTWFKNGFVKSLIQTGRKRDARLGDVPTLYELMDKQKTPDSLRRMATVVLVLRRLRPADGGAAGNVRRSSADDSRRLRQDAQRPGVYRRGKETALRSWNRYPGRRCRASPRK